MSNAAAVDRSDVVAVQGRLVASIGRGGKLGDTSSVQVNAAQAVHPVMTEMWAAHCPPVIWLIPASRYLT